MVSAKANDQEKVLSWNQGKKVAQKGGSDDMCHMLLVVMTDRCLLDLPVGRSLVAWMMAVSVKC